MSSLKNPIKTWIRNSLTEQLCNCLISQINTRPHYTDDDEFACMACFNGDKKERKNEIKWESKSETKRDAKEGKWKKERETGREGMENYKKKERCLCQAVEGLWSWEWKEGIYRLGRGRGEKCCRRDIKKIVFFSCPLWKMVSKMV